VGSNIKN